MSTERDPAPTAVVATAAALILLVARPTGAPLAWLAVPLLAAVLAARSGAAADAEKGGDGAAATRGRRMAGLILAAAAAEFAWRSAVTVLFGASVAVADVVPALATAGLVVAARSVAQRMARHAHEAIEHGRTFAGLRTDVLATAVTVLAASGWVHHDIPPAVRWAVGMLVVAHVATGAAHLQAVKRRALTAAWERSGRRASPDLPRAWAAWTSAALVTLVVTTALWVVPPMAPVRTATENAPRDVVTRVTTRFDPTRPHVVPDGTFDQFVNEPVGGDGATLEEGPWAYAVAGIVLALLASRVVRLQRSRSGQKRGPAAMLRRLLLGLASLRELFGRDRSRAPQAVAEPGTASPPRRRRGWKRPSTPRAQVIHDYLRTLDRAERAGLGRAPSQLPSYYADELGTHLPDEHGAITTLTERFTTARYGTEPTSRATAEETKQLGRQIRTALREAGRRPPQ